MKFSKTKRRKKIHGRVRQRIKGTAQRPRLNIFRSNKYIYGHLIDDVQGVTLASASSLEATVTQDGNKVNQASATGKLLAERAKAANIETVIFDRGGYLYHGRVKAFADGAREGGLNF